MNNENKKLCLMCNEVKNLESGFYRAGVTYQKYCKPCHNANRKKYTIKYNYVKKNNPKGFAKLPEDIRKKILYDISVRINYKEIAKKYNLNYKTLLSWKRKGHLI